MQTANRSQTLFLMLELEVLWRGKEGRGLREREKMKDLDWSRDRCVFLGRTGKKITKRKKEHEG